MMAFSFRVSTNWCHDFPKLARESGFYFNMHRSRIRIDWNRISSIDIGRIIEERDFLTVDQNINNVIDYCLESEYDVKILDPSFVKLFRLAQLAVEYLLYCKQYLDHSVVILKDELRLKIEDNVRLKKELANTEENVKQLKEQLKEKCRLLESKISKTNGEIHKCPYCPKTFASALFVTAHVTRRHSYISDLCFPSSPAHDLYRAETEKLHSEIKTLKERLNQTERVIGKGPEEANNDTRTSRFESKDYPRNADANDMIQEQGKKYQAEINSLKSILFDEIHNLRQKDSNAHKPPENTPDNGLKLLMNQQEKEIQRLREQLLERVTPDIESVHSKLQAQETFWRSKIEHLERQHGVDIKNLTQELKETQEAATRTKSEYESKVRNLEKQSMNQSNILTEQRKQLNILTREINNSQATQSEHFKDPESSTLRKSCDPLRAYEQDLKRYKKVTDACCNPKTSKSADKANLIEQDADTVDSEEQTVKNLLTASKRQYVQKNSWNPDTVRVNPKEYTDIQDVNTDRTERETKRSVGSNAKHVKPTNKLTYAYQDEDDRRVNRRSPQLSKRRPIDHVRVEDVDSSRKSRKSRLDNGIVNPTPRYADPNVSGDDKVRAYRPESNKRRASGNVINDSDEESSRITSESSVSDSESESEEDSAVSVENDVAVKDVADSDKDLSSSSMESIQQEEAPLIKEFSEIIREGLNKRLMDLGINPEWEGIPRATFQQKMELVKHHQNINAKKFPRYNQIKSKVLEQIASRISGSQKIAENPKYAKKSSLDKFMTNVKSKAIKVFSAQKDPSQQKFVAKSKNDASHRLPLKQRTDLPPAPSKRNSFTSVTDSPHLSPERNEAIRVGEKESPENEENSSSYFSRSPTRATYAFHRASTPINEAHGVSNVAEPFSNVSGIGQALGTSNKETSRRESHKNNDVESLTTEQESVLTPLTSPKNNKSVLKSATGSVGSLVKKKVFFDLDTRNGRNLLSEYAPKRMELNNSDENVSSISDESENVLRKEKSMSADSIVLKTTQSDKIAEISKKIEEQLRISRQKPVGAIEAMFLSKPSQSSDRSSNNNVQSAFSNAATILAEHLQSTPVKPKQANNQQLPQPAPRNLKEGTTSNSRDSRKQLDVTKDFDLDTDIDEILQA